MSKLLSEATFGDLLDEVQIRYVNKLSESILHKHGVSKPEQEQKLSRKQVVTQAGIDVAQLEPDGWFDTMYIEYVINREKRTVVALIRGVSSNRVFSRGKAKCDSTDCFNEQIGKAIALRRALNREIPDKYINAPQPEGAQVGDEVRVHYARQGGYFEGEVSEVHESHLSMFDRDDFFLTLTDGKKTSIAFVDGDKVIDDTGRY